MTSTRSCGWKYGAQQTLSGSGSRCEGATVGSRHASDGPQKMHNRWA